MFARSRLRLGLSMRTVDAQGYVEPRDAIAQDWGVFLAAHLPECTWMPIPNLGEGVGAYVEEWGINALVLTGGNDIGDSPLRDATETALLSTGHPVLGICRGFQMIQCFFGGALTAVDRSVHVAKDHPVETTSALRAYLNVPMEPLWTVNSYHGSGIRRDALADGLEPLATCADGTVEAAIDKTHRRLGIMWHPERHSEPTALEIPLIRRFLGVENAAS